jgi:hypothetical protein
MNTKKPDGRRNNGGHKCGGRKSKDGKLFYELHFKKRPANWWRPQVHRARPKCDRIGCGNDDEDKITELRPGCYQCDLCSKVWDISMKGL